MATRRVCPIRCWKQWQPGYQSLATRHGGIPEAIEHGVNGWLVAEGDHAALGQALVDLAADPARLSALADAAAKSVAENFALSTQTRKLEDYYQEAMEEAWISSDAGKD